MKTPKLLSDINSHLRSYQEAAAYPPNQAFLGAMHPDKLGAIERPWFRGKGEWQRRYPHGEIIPEGPGTAPRPYFNPEN